jgi:hypothetical protein
LRPGRSERQGCVQVRGVAFSVVGLCAAMLLTGCGGDAAAQAGAGDATRVCASWLRDAPTQSGHLTEVAWANRKDVASEYPRADLSHLRGEWLAVCQLRLDEPIPRTSPPVTKITAALDRQGNSTWLG